MKYLFIFCFLLLTACSGGAGLNLGHYPDAKATKDNFIYCHGYGCTKKVRLGFSVREWQNISKIFKRKSKTAQEERIKIGKAIALMEQYTGDLAGTTDDMAKAPLRRKNYYELDCIDETLNTTKYLTFMEQAKFFTFHDVGRPAFKGNLILGIYPHNTATIIDRETRVMYVVDSYIYENGAPPDIRELDSWYKYRVENLLN